MTVNDNFQVSNSRMLEISDLTQNPENNKKIIDYLLSIILASPDFEYLRIHNSLHAIEFFLKNGSQNFQSILVEKQGLEEISKYSSFTYMHKNHDKGLIVRLLAESILEMINSQDVLQNERTIAQ